MFKILDDECNPTRGTKHSACIDLYASEDIVIGAGETKLVGLGVAIDLDKLIDNSNGMFDNSCFDNLSGGWCGGEFEQGLLDEFLSSHYLQLMLRSSLSKELIIANGVGVIDLDYKDEIKIRLHNPVNLFYTHTTAGTIPFLYENGTRKTNDFTIKKGDRIAQITLLEHKAYLFGIESDVERDGGFGSTNKKGNENV